MIDRTFVQSIFQVRSVLSRTGSEGILIQMDLMNPVDEGNILSGMPHCKIILDYFNSITDDEANAKLHIEFEGESWGGGGVGGG